ncbi:hypothetical protein [Nocardia concava]|uniref:hypothetical protein n=1 Tax=Nocardia concava TaxID=257281 RepID=UPI0002E23A38|nr:hypothetical protein [Nocardia concava]
MVNAYYHVAIYVSLSDQIPDDRLAELRWHLGLAPRPNGPTSLNRDGLPLPFRHEPAFRPDDEDLFADLTPRSGGGWFLTARQEVDTDDLAPLASLFHWLAPWIHPIDIRPDGSIPVGDYNFYDSTSQYGLILQDGHWTLANWM